MWFRSYKMDDSQTFKIQYDARELPNKNVVCTGQSVQSLSCVQLFATPWTVAHQASLSVTSSWSLLRLMLTNCWCHPAISFSVPPFSSCFQSFPASGSFLRSQFFASGGQSIVVSASTSVLPMNIQDWFPLGVTGLILQSKGQHHCSKASILWCSAFIIVQLSNTYITAGKTRALTRWTFAGKVMSLLFNMLSILS